MWVAGSVFVALVIHFHEDVEIGTFFHLFFPLFWLNIDCLTIDFKVAVW